MEHNIFISYAWVDNEIYPGADQGWVSTFVDGLRKNLARELGRKDQAERLWLDYEQMRGNDSVTPAILKHLEASRTLLLILSNGYVASPWCRQELDTFVNKVGPNSDRIFVVQMSPVDQEPESLSDLVKYNFSYLDEKKQPRTRWFPFVDPTDREYAPEQQRLARDLAVKINTLLTQEAPEPTKFNRTKKSESSLKPAEKPKSQAYSERFVLIDGGAEDRELIYDIAKRLEQRNLSVALSLSTINDQSGVKSSDITRDLRTKLKLCDSVLMVYHHGPVDQVSQHLVECLKAYTKPRKDRAPPTIDLCQTSSDSLALGLRPRNMRIHVVDKSCTNDCVEWFLKGDAT